MNEPETEDLYEMANLQPKSTGLPMVVWVSERGYAQHDVRVKVSMGRGRMNIQNTAVLGVRPTPWPTPWLVSGYLITHLPPPNGNPAAAHLRVIPLLAADDLKAVSDWATLNEQALVDYWERTIDTIELAQRLQTLP